jgi:hypothetical protein
MLQEKPITTEQFCVISYHPYLEISHKISRTSNLKSSCLSFPSAGINKHEPPHPAIVHIKFVQYDFPVNNSTTEDFII